MEKILITGARGYIGACLTKHLSTLFRTTAAYFRKSPLYIPDIKWKKLDVTDKNSVEKVFEESLPNVVVHCSAIASIAECEINPYLAEKVNVEGTDNMVKACTKFGAYLLFLSTDMVFDGENAPYDEHSIPSPLSVYGKTKLEAEKLCPPTSLVLRLSLCYSHSVCGRKSFLEKAIEKIKQGEKVVFFHDEWRSPLWIWDLAKVVERIIKHRPTGILHLGGTERMSRLEMAERACKIYGIDSSFIEIASRVEFHSPPRPKDLTLDISNFKLMFPDFSFTSFEKVLSLRVGG